MIGNAQIVLQFIPCFDEIKDVTFLFQIARKRTDLLAELKERGFAPFQDDSEDASGKEVDSLEEASISEENMPDNSYEYLLGMKIWSLTFERAEELRVQRGQKIKEAESLEATPPAHMWLADLDAIEILLDERDKALGIDSQRQKCIQAVNRTSLPKNAGRKRNEKTPIAEVNIRLLTCLVPFSTA